MQKLLLLATVAGLTYLTVHANSERTIVVIEGDGYAMLSPNTVPTRLNKGTTQPRAEYPAMRKVMGKLADGKSDTDVELLYRQHMADLEEQADSANTTNRSIGN